MAEEAKHAKLKAHRGQFKQYHVGENERAGEFEEEGEYPVLTIPVQFVILHSSTTHRSYVDPLRLQPQINVLNEGYSGCQGECMYAG